MLTFNLSFDLLLDFLDEKSLVLLSDFFATKTANQIINQLHLALELQRSAETTDQLIIASIPVIETDEIVEAIQILAAASTECAKCALFRGCVLCTELTQGIIAEATRLKKPLPADLRVLH